MSVVRSLWASVQGDPRFMRSVNGWLTIFWIVMIPVSIVTGWVSSLRKSPPFHSGRWCRAIGQPGKQPESR